ncbi:MAG: class I SAM-dependent methyltransferase [Thermomicrobiales bacterium]
MTTAPAAPAATTAFTFACPHCQGDLLVSGATARCLACQESFSCTEGIWQFCTAGDSACYATFLHEYATVRAAEAWGAGDSTYYRALPYAPAGDSHGEVWAIRAQHYEALLERVVRPLAASEDRPLSILDLGAGNGWLAYRLATLGHHVAAVDLSSDVRDGLGVHRYYADADSDSSPFMTIQATFDHLPFAAAQADLVVFNAALHYSTDYAATLTEALRVLRPTGALVIMDTPCYRRAAAGDQMVREREEQFAQQFGFRSSALACENYLTPQRLAQLGADLHIAWRTVDAPPPWRTTAHAWRARLRGRREPATMPLVVGTPSPPGPLARITGRGERAERAGVRATRRTAARFLLRWRYRLFQRGRYDRLVVERVAGVPIVVLPQVFNPKLLRTGEFLARTLDTRTIPLGTAVLDLGTGSGIGAIFAARWAGHVVAVDINPDAVRCARMNALLHRLDERIAVRQGDLFAPVMSERFDVVLFNPPYYRGTPRDALDHAWRSPDIIERFAAGLRDHLTPGGSALVVLSTDGVAAAFLRACAEAGFGAEVVRRRDFVNEVLTVYRLRQLMTHDSRTHDHSGDRHAHPL